MPGALDPVPQEHPLLQAGGHEEACQRACALARNSLVITIQDRPRDDLITSPLKANRARPGQGRVEGYVPIPRSRPPMALFALLPLLMGCESSPEAAPPEPEVDVVDLQSDDTAPNPAPGAEPFPALTATRIAEAWDGRPEGYLPRTRHFAEDGSPLYTNRLFLETSPYLHQHAHNPVNWYAWGDEAFEAAADLGRPVLLSVGYSTCHWCHVMEEESFEDPEIARYMNENYIAIKVDREERPDVDAVYMAAVHLIAGRGGWPMTVWLTPDRKPYYGGTYFPARDGDRGTRMGFLTMLKRLKEAYDEQPDKVAASSEDLTAQLRANLVPSMAGDLPDGDDLRRVASRFKAG